MKPIQLNIDHILYLLLGGFLFLLPFEHILEVFFDIETVFKPYRICTILVVIFYGLKVIHNGFGKVYFLQDLPLYLIFGYGIFISLIRMTQGELSMRLFNNDLFQIGLYLMTYFVLKNVGLDRQKWVRLFWCLTWGIFLNSFYIFNAFFFQHIYKRHEGFMNNPNYVALSIVVAVVFILYRTSVTQNWLRKAFYGMIVLFLLFVFPVTGSRTGLAMMAVMFLMLFVFATWRTKFLSLLAAGMIGSFFISQNVENFNVGASFILTTRVQNKIGVEDVRVAIWKGALRAADEANYLGMGIGQFKANFSSIFQREYHKTILEFVNRGSHMSAHSDFMTLLVVYGFVGLLLYLYFLFSISKKLLSRIYLSQKKEDRRFFQFNLLMIISLVIFGIGSENFLSPIYWAILGLATLASEFSRSNFIANKAQPH